MIVCLVTLTASAIDSIFGSLLGGAKGHVV